MAELENEEVIDKVTEVTDENNEDTQEFQEVNQEEQLTWEQVNEWKAKAERLDKAEKKLVEQKKALKEKNKQEQNNTPISSKEDFKKLLAEEKFYDKNPEAESYRDKIEKYQDKGLSLDEAYTLASRDDKKIEETRNVYGQSIVKGQSNSDSISVVSMDTFDNMTPSAQEEYTTKMTKKYGKIKFK